MKIRFLSLIVFSFLFCHAIHAENSVTYTMVILGDSITEGYGLEKNKAYPQIISDLFSKDRLPVKVINAGISGSTSSTALQRLKWFLKSKPDTLVIALGANDGLRGIPTTTLEKNLSATIDLALENKLHVVLVGMMLPPNYGEAYRKDFQNVFKTLSKKKGVDFIPFLLEGVAGDKNLNQEDGIHPNEKGQKRIADHLYKDLRVWIKPKLKKK